MAPRKTSKHSKARTMLRLSDLEQSKNAVLHSLGAASSQESYGHAIEEFIGWYCSEPRLAFNRTVGNSRKEGPELFSSSLGFALCRWRRAVVPKFGLCSKSLCLKQPTMLRRSHSQKHKPILREVRMEPTISTEDLKAKLDRKDPVKIVETLAPERYREAHLPGALNIPPEQIKELAPRLLPNKDSKIVTYCTSLH